ncbi:hypothetical protein MPSEU_001075600 [Mayamaea pseudoterrestris]|nr:hypothetical protein MPSEU_001075600 [Mayamaea pseudoterrestris]
MAAIHARGGDSFSRFQWLKMAWIASTTTCLSPPIPSPFSRTCLRTQLIFVIVTVAIVLFNYDFFKSQLPFATKRESPLSKQHSTGACFTARFSVESISQTRDLPYKWAKDSNGTMRYVGDAQMFDRGADSFEKRYRTYTGYQQCLGNKHIVLIGDSRVRYQYMGLANYLTTGEWLQCRDYENGTNTTNATTLFSSSSNCFLIDHEYGNSTVSWKKWYARSSESLQDQCDCSRPTPFRVNTTFENRFFEVATQSGPIRLTYLQTFLDSVKFHPDFPPLTPWTSDMDEGITDTRAFSSRCQPGLCSDAPVLTLSTREALLEMIPKLHPTHVFANTGWKHNEGETPQQLGCALQRFSIENPSVQAYVISHTWVQGSMDIAVPTHGCNAKVFDRLTPTIGVPQSWYWDNLHSLLIVNQELNHLLLDMVCGPMSADNASACGDD